MTEKEYQKQVKDMLALPGAKEVKAQLEPKTIYGMFKWVREHADYLDYFEGYNSKKIEEVMKHYSGTIGILALSTHPDAHQDALNLSVATVVQLELACR